MENFYRQAMEKIETDWREKLEQTEIKQSKKIQELLSNKELPQTDSMRLYKAEEDIEPVCN
jgi:hypothetical protein